MKLKNIPIIIFNKILTICFSLLITCIALEYVARLAPQKQLNAPWLFISQDSGINKGYSLDIDRIYKINPNIEVDQLFRSDANGFRYNYLHATASSSAIRIILAGDSATFGYGVKNVETYPFMLEKILTDHGFNVLIDNAGVPGYGLDQEFEYIISELIPKSPRILVWNLNINDITDSNDACLFSKNRDVFNKISGKYNTLYITRAYIYPFVAKHEWIFKNSSTLRYLLSLIPPRYTIGCTVANTHYKDIKFIEKAAFFFKTANELAKINNTILVLNLLLNESEFVKFPHFDSFSGQQEWLSNQKRMFTSAATESGLQVIDDRIQLSTLMSENESIDDYIYRSYFLSNEPTTDEIGWHHLSPYGNSMTAIIVKNALMQYLP